MTATAEDSSADGPHQGPTADTPPLDTLPLDTMANLRLLGEVQKRGLEAANLVIARLTERTNAPGAAPDGATPSDPLTAMAEAFVESVTAVATAMAPGSATAPGARGRDTGGSGLPEVLAAVGAPGGPAEVELWVHNYTEEPATAVEIHTTDLLAAHGGRIAADLVTVRPERPFDLSAASSRSVRVVVEVPPGTPAGRYRGVVGAAHLADLWLVLEVEVRPVVADGPVDDPS